jgi:hypothetical protein
MFQTSLAESSTQAPRGVRLLLHLGEHWRPIQAGSAIQGPLMPPLLFGPLGVPYPTRGSTVIH